MAVHEFHIYDLDGMESYEISDYLDEQGTHEFALEIPVYEEDEKRVAPDYLLAAYLGEKLAEVASAFDYEKVAPLTKGDITFRFKAQPIYLGSLLWYFSQTFNSQGNTDEGYQLYREQLDFAQQVESGALKPACPYLMEVYVKYKGDGK